MSGFHGGLTVWTGTATFVLQGNGQGKVSIPDDYLIYQCDILETVDKALTGYHIGSISITTPTCADDMLILDTDP